MINFLRLINSKPEHAVKVVRPLLAMFLLSASVPVSAEDWFSLN